MKRVAVFICILLSLLVMVGTVQMLCQTSDISALLKKTFEGPLSYLISIQSHITPTTLPS